MSTYISDSSIIQHEKSAIKSDSTSIGSQIIQGVGARTAATQHVMQTPWAALQPKIAAGTPTPPVDTPATPPAAATHETQRVLHPV